MKRDVTVREVGLRDGLQIVQTFFPTAAKIEWLQREAASGVTEIEVCSFVPVKVVPQFADSEQVVAAALQVPDLTVSALVPNLKGAERGFALGVHKMNFVLSVSESHNMKNVRRTSDESAEQFRQIVEARRADPATANVQLGCGLSTSFGCTIEGRVEEAAVLRLAEKIAALGPDEIAVADTVGYANPAQVKSLFKALKRELPEITFAAHFHNTRGLGLANVVAALEADIRLFDASLAGLGGCPFAPGATGNIVMDDLVFMVEAMGLATGVDLDQLLALRELVAENLPDEPLHGAVAKARPPKGFVPASALTQAAE